MHAREKLLGQFPSFCVYVREELIRARVNLARMRVGVLTAFRGGTLEAFSGWDQRSRTMRMNASPVMNPREPCGAAFSEYSVTSSGRM